MEKKLNRRLWGFLGRFSLVYAITYTVIGLAFLIFQGALPASDRVALDFFQPYQQPGPMIIVEQLFRGGVMALILYPFYETILSDNNGWLYLIAVLWGLALLGSVEPVPGSIEGLIYTKTTLAEHFVVLAAGALQILIFSWLFLFWERWCIKNKFEGSNL